MTLDVLLFILGSVLVFSGLIGGGLEIKELKIPKLNTTTRTVAVVGGLMFIALGYLTGEKDSIPTAPDNPTESSASVFNNPKIGSYRLDWCYTWGDGCGRRAATAWCKRRGYGKAIDFIEDVDVGKQSVVTKVIGSGQLCEEDFCDAFKKIICQ